MGDENTGVKFMLFHVKQYSNAIPPSEKCFN